MKLSVEERKERASKIIHGAASASAAMSGVAGAVPIIGALDSVPLTAITVGMIAAIATLFDKVIQKEEATRILQELAGSTLGIGSAKVILGLVPGLGTFANSAISHAYIETIGWRVFVYFEKKEQPSQTTPHPPHEEVSREIGERRHNVFVCYSHKNKICVDRFLIVCKPIKDRFEIFSDKDIPPGSPWFEMIRQALGRTKVAVLFVSPDFLASDFIQKSELPSLLESAKRELAVIFPVIVSPILTTKVVNEILQYQSPVQITKPLSKMKSAERDETYVQIATAIRDILGAENNQLPPAEPVV